MYHYVRDTECSRHPRLKARSIEDFDGQLDYIEQHYAVCSMREFIDARAGRCQLPSNACLLTFDDGFAEHFDTVFPRLLARGFSGSFFPPAMPIREGLVLSVHKLHFVLASTDQHAAILVRALALVNAARERGDSLPDDASLMAACDVPNRFDSRDVAFLKRLLQTALPESLRDSIVDTLFCEFAGEDERVLSRELYLDMEQLRCMAKNGMEIGGHGYHHRWTGELPPQEQQFEIEQSVALLTDVTGQVPSEWVACYPSGSWNSTTVELLQAAGCACGLTTRVDLAALDGDRWAIPRLDTNDLPTTGTSTPVAWTVRVIPSNQASEN